MSWFTVLLLASNPWWFENSFGYNCVFSSCLQTEIMRNEFERLGARQPLELLSMKRLGQPLFFPLLFLMLIVAVYMFDKYYLLVFLLSLCCTTYCKGCYIIKLHWYYFCAGTSCLRPPRARRMTSPPGRRVWTTPWRSWSTRRSVLRTWSSCPSTAPMPGNCITSEWRCTAGWPEGQGCSKGGEMPTLPHYHWIRDNTLYLLSEFNTLRQEGIIIGSPVLLTVMLSYYALYQSEISWDCFTGALKPMNKLILFSFLVFIKFSFLQQLGLHDRDSPKGTPEIQVTNQSPDLLCTNVILDLLVAYRVL